jgi:hypothetical protein
LSPYVDAMRLRDRLTYANVTATIALFIALGGTSYAVATLPRNSVGSEQLRSNAVDASEIRRGAVRSSEIRDSSIRLRDISKATKDSLHGQTGPQGPPGPTFAATINSAGLRVRGNATGSESNVFGTRVISFTRSVASCVPSVSLTQVPGGGHPVPPHNAHVRAETTSDGRVIVRMFDPMGAPETYPFNLIVAC